MRTRRWIGMTLAAIVTALLMSSAQASEIRCRADPVVLLSDGTVFDLSADVATMLWDIQSVHYAMRVPKGVRVVAVVRTPNWPTAIETFTITADAEPGEYDTETTVVTGKKGVAVRANLLVVSKLKSALQWQDGRDRSPIRVRVQLR